MTGRKWLSTSRPWCHHDARSTPTLSSIYSQHSRQTIMYCFPAVSREKCKSGGLLFTLTDAQCSTMAPVSHIYMGSQKRDHSTIVALWKGPWIKRWSGVSPRTVKSLQIRAPGDKAPASPTKTMCLCYIKHFNVFICLPGCVGPSCDWKLLRVFLPLWKNTSKCSGLYNQVWV